MTEIRDLLEANQRYADARARVGDSRPWRHLAIVTCMDARIDVFAVLGLRLGEAHVLRNAGGRVTEDVLRSLALSVHAFGVDTVVVMQHTRCGLAGVTDEELRRTTGADLGFLPIEHHETALRDDIAVLERDRVPVADHLDRRVRLRHRQRRGRGSGALGAARRAERRRRGWWTMKYMLLIYGNDDVWSSIGPEERRRLVADTDALNERLFESGELVGAYGVADQSRSRVVTVKDGTRFVTDGPYLEAKEFLGSFSVIECASLERALEIAALNPASKYTGVEVRPLEHEADHHPT